MPANDAELEKMIKQALKKPRNFAFAYKGKKIALFVSKKKIQNATVKELKSKVGATKSFEGVCVKEGSNFVFKSLVDLPEKSKLLLKDHVKSEGGISIKPKLKKVSEIEDVDEDDEKEMGKPTNAAPHKFDGVRLIFPDSDTKRVAPGEFDVGAMLRAMVTDLVAQGVEDPSMFKIKSSAVNKAIADSVKAGRPDAYVQVGVYKNGSLLLQVRDASDKKWGQSAEVRAKYTQTIDEIKAETVSVINADKGDDTIDESTKQQGERFGVEPTTPGNTKLGKITGNIVLTAHGTPKEVITGAGPGRVIGTELAGTEPKGVVEFLIDAGLRKDYKGKLTLAGCYTGAGGPSAVKKERTFAERVSSQLIKKGYKTVEIISYPGSTRTGTGNSMGDSFGDQPGKGKEKVDVASQTVRGEQEADKMSNEEQMEAKKKLQAALKDYDAQRKKLRTSIGKTRPVVEKAMGKTDDNSFDKRVKLLMNSKTKGAVDSYLAATEALDSATEAERSLEIKASKDAKSVKKADLEAAIAGSKEARDDARARKSVVVALASKVFKGGGGSYDAQVALLTSDKFKAAVQSFCDDKKTMHDLEELIATDPVLQISGYEGKVNRQSK